MDILLVPVILLLVMYATARSVAAGVLACGVLAGGALWLARGATAPAPVWHAVGMVTSGLLLGGLSRGKVAPRHVLVGATVPLALVLAYGALTWEREALARRGLDPDVDWMVEADGDAAAAGGILFHYNLPYGDLYMSVAEPLRRRGYGSYLVQELKRTCYQMGRVPSARCNAANAASRATLQKAGMLPCARVLVGLLTR